LLASVGYDQAFLAPDGALARIEGRGDCGPCSNTGTHTDITLAAAEDAGYSASESQQILAANLARDEGMWNLLNNQDHFDFAAQEAFKSFKDQAAELTGSAGDGRQVLTALGSASHHLQDQYAVGHILPGTSFFRTPVGAPIRFIVHNLVGGEVTFRQASYDATREFLQSARGI
jgi:hypothetical protein